MMCSRTAKLTAWQKTKLLESEIVLRYLGSTDEKPLDVAETNDEDDFS